MPTAALRLEVRDGVADDAAIDAAEVVGDGVGGPTLANLHMASTIPSSVGAKRIWSSSRDKGIRKSICNSGLFLWRGRGFRARAVLPALRPIRS